MANSNAPVKIINCTCEHAFQDATYGKGKRIANPKAVGDSKSKQEYRCTVCSKEA